MGEKKSPILKERLGFGKRREGGGEGVVGERRCHFKETFSKIIVIIIMIIIEEWKYLYKIAIAGIVNTVVSLILGRKKVRGKEGNNVFRSNIYRYIWKISPLSFDRTSHAVVEIFLERVSKNRNYERGRWICFFFIGATSMFTLKKCFFKVSPSNSRKRR